MRIPKGIIANGKLLNKKFEHEKTCDARHDFEKYGIKKLLTV